MLHFGAGTLDGFVARRRTRKQPAIFGRLLFQFQYDQMD